MIKLYCWHADQPETLKIRYQEGEDEGIIKDEFCKNPYHIEKVPENSVVLDLGAHIGTFALHVAKMRGCKVYAYEPAPDTFKLLVENVRMNNLDDQIKCFKQAVASKSGIRKLWICGKTSAPGYGLFLDEHPDAEEIITGFEMVQCVTLKQIFDENKIKHVGCLKMDIEEAEREVFSEESKPYLSKVNYLAMEWHNYDGQKYSEYMKKLGFSVLLMGTGEGSETYEPSFQRGMLYAKRDVK